MMAKKTIEIILEIGWHYNTRNRSVTARDKICQYNGPGGKVCAFSYMVKPEFRDRLIEGASPIDLAKSNPEWFKEEYSGKSPQFYADMQALHDHPDNWDQYGLTKEGRKELVVVINRNCSVEEVQEYMTWLRHEIDTINNSEQSFVNSKYTVKKGDQLALLEANFK